jgi:hypothetical protein
MNEGEDSQVHATKLIEIINPQCQDNMRVVCISYNFIVSQALATLVQIIVLLTL